MESSSFEFIDSSYKEESSLYAGKLDFKFLIIKQLFHIGFLGSYLHLYNYGQDFVHAVDMLEIWFSSYFDKYYQLEVNKINQEAHLAVMSLQPEHILKSKYGISLNSAITEIQIVNARKKLKALVRLMVLKGIFPTKEITDKI